MITKKELIHKNKHLTLVLWAYTIIFFILMYLLFWNNIMHLAYKATPRITLDDTINSSEQKQIREYLELLQPEYYGVLKNVYFTKNLSKLGESWNEGMVIVGKNVPLTNKIKIYYSGIPYNDLDTICHEILHSVLNYPNEEWFVQDITLDLPCFKYEETKKYLKEEK